MEYTRLLSKGRVEYSDKYGDSGVRYFTVRNKGEPTLDDLADVWLTSRQCWCSHDCCGCLQFWTPRVVRRLKRNEWLISQHFYRNI